MASAGGPRQSIFLGKPSTESPTCKTFRTKPRMLGSLLVIAKAYCFDMVDHDYSFTSSSSTSRFFLDTYLRGAVLFRDVNDRSDTTVARGSIPCVTTPVHCRIAPASQMANDIVSFSQHRMHTHRGIRSTWRLGYMTERIRSDQYMLLAYPFLYRCH